jgi:hypothetical protein
MEVVNRNPTFGSALLDVSHHMLTPAAMALWIPFTFSAIH